MEYGIRLERPAPPPDDPRDLLPGWGGCLPRGSLRALYFGTEFCEERLPEVAEAAAFCDLAATHGLEACLLTPLVTERGLGRTGGLLAALERSGRVPTVVANDWGVLSLVRERFPRHRTRAGRLFNRGLRDPRVERSPPGAPPNPATSRPGRGQPEPRGARFRGLLRRWGASGVESDPDLEVGFLGDGSEGLCRALHVPYAFVSSGRNCLMRSVGREPGFTKALGQRCGAGCRSGPLPVRREDVDVPLWRAGNTLFCAVPEPRVRAHLPLADRVVLHERPIP